VWNNIRQRKEGRMSVKNVAVGLWKVAVSVRVPLKPYPVKRKATVKGTKADAKLKEAELLRVALDEGQGQGESSLTAGTVASTFNKVVTLQDGISLYLEKCDQPHIPGRSCSTADENLRLAQGSKSHLL